MTPQLPEGTTQIKGPQMGCLASVEMQEYQTEPSPPPSTGCPKQAWKGSVQEARGQKPVGLVALPLAGEKV